MLILNSEETHLTTAKILYRLPDYPNILQTYIWQDLDKPPRFPKLKGFLNFWITKLDGKLYEVHVMHSELFVSRFYNAKDLGSIH